MTWLLEPGMLSISSAGRMGEAITDSLIKRMYFLNVRKHRAISVQACAHSNADH